MRRTLGPATWLLLLTLWGSFTAAEEPDRPEITKAELSGSVLALEFNEPMLTWTGSTAPPGVSIDPPFACNWTWSNDTELQCNGENQAAGARPATRYRVSVQGGLWSQHGTEIGTQVMFADSERPTVDASVSAWKDGQPTIHVSTNVAVTAAALHSVLSAVLDDGTAVDFELKPLPNPLGTRTFRQRADWRMTVAPVVGENRTLTLHVNPGLSTTDGDLRGEQKAVLLLVRLNEPFELRMVGCSSRDYRSGNTPHAMEVSKAPTSSASIACPAGEPIWLELSDGLSPSALALLRSHLPRGLHYENTDTAGYYWGHGDDKNELKRPGHFVGLASDSPNQTLIIELPTSLTADTGASLAHATRVIVESSDYVPKFAATPSRLLLPIKADTPAMLSAVNIAALDVDQHEIDGGEPRTNNKKTIPGGLKNKLVQVSPPQPDRELRDRGGLVDGTVKSHADAGNYPSQQNYSIAHAAFNITSSVAGRQCLVWVTEWKGAAAVANAKVELLLTESPQEITVLATATTDADGIAIFDRPDVASNQKLWHLLVRVSRDNQRALIPLTTALSSKRSRDTDYSALEEGGQISWGVSDRPLYRPGDTVHYRLWTRERQQNHLRLVSQLGEMKFSFQSQYSSTPISSFTTTLDSYGSVAGELRLPATLHDDNYCIGATSHSYSSAQGVCFRVTGYHINELWAELHADRDLAREGDTLILDAAAGYYSGGAAVGAQADFQSLLTPLRLEDAYPKFHQFTFIDPFEKTAGSGGENFSEALQTRLRTDEKGHARIEAKLVNPSLQERLAESHSKPIPFGKLELTAAINSSASSWATSAPATLRFSRHARFVGLKIDPWLLRDDADPQVETVVISDAGDSVADAPVHVVIEEVVAAADDSSAADNKPLAQCELRSGQVTTCAFRPPHSGRYRFRATSADAAEASVERYAFIGGHWTESDVKDRASLISSDEIVTIGSSVQLVLQQPFAKAEVLFTAEHGRVFKHWLQHVDSPVTKISVPIEQDWAPGITINAVILDAADAAFGREAPEGQLIETASVDLKVSGGAADQLLVLAVDRAQVHPGDEVAITLRNPAANPSQVTVAMVDDAARALVPEFAEATDPKGTQWLGRLSSWSVPTWYGLGDWPRHVGTESSAAPSVFNFSTGAGGQALETIVVTGSNIQAADVFSRGASSDHSLGRPKFGADGAGSSLRSHFAESALWKSDLELAPNAEQTLHVKLPDNLTRWRVLAWSADAADGFGLAQATVEAALPIEVRSEVPTRLFPGDRTIIAASVRNHDTAARAINAKLLAKGAGVNNNAVWQGTIATNAQHQISLTALPNAIGRIEVDARANDKDVADGVAAFVEVASPLVQQHLPVAGWLPSEGVHLKLPALPAGALHSRIHVQVGRGLLALAKSWADALRDYPHRCWEQILSRAVGAAAAKRLGLAKTVWADADAVIDEALRAAGQFQDSSGFMNFFAVQNDSATFAPNLYLTAYTVKSLSFLRELGYAIPTNVEQGAKKALEGVVTSQQNNRPLATQHRGLEELAASVAAVDPAAAITPGTIDHLWNKREKLSGFGRANLARALSTRSKYFPMTREFGDRTNQLVDELRHAGVKHGTRRVLEGKSSAEWPFGSSVMDQCGVLDALIRFDHGADAEPVRNQFLRGLNDLYSGGAPVLDTQASAQCLMMLVEALPSSGDDEPLTVQVSGGGVSGSVAMAPHQAVGEWVADFATLPPALDLHVTLVKDALLSFVANVEYDLDGRQAQSAAIGFSLERRYSVLREHAWKDVPAASIHEGDWVRVTLRFNTKDMRRFIAVTDTVPGGLRPTDLELAGVSDVELRQLSTNGSPYFPERQVDDRYARFYSEQVPPGTHEICYYARATQRGHYAALPAVAEMMYGTASVARTTSMSVEVSPSVRH